MGTMFLAAASGKSGGSGFFFIILIVGVLALMYFMTIRPQRARQRQAVQTQRELTPGSWVRTTAGIYGTVTSVEGDDVTLEVAPGVEIRLLRRAILDVLSGGGAGFGPRSAAGAHADYAEADDEADEGHEADDGHVTEDSYAAEDSHEAAGSHQAEPAGDTETTPGGGAPGDGAGGTVKRSKSAGGAGTAGSAT